MTKLSLDAVAGADELQVPPELPDNGLFDGDSIRHLIDQHQAGDWDSATLWALYTHAGFQCRLVGTP